jgi:GT2 family glycosyltransferase
VRDDRAFNFAALHNRVVGRLAGEIVVLLNNDVEVIGPDWLERLVAQAVRPEVGAVGAKLYYPTETVQHAGMVLGVAGAARHVLVGRRRGDPGPHGLLEVARTLQAVTGACLALRRSLYEAVGGMNGRWPSTTTTSTSACACGSTATP